MEEGASAKKKMPPTHPPDWPVGKPVVRVHDGEFIWEGTIDVDGAIPS